jgi:hypothetical protein
MYSLFHGGEAVLTNKAAAWVTVEMCALFRTQQEKRRDEL